jgi:hypothetical protein
VESRVIEGWRSRSEREVREAKAAFHSVDRAVIYEEISSTFDDRNESFGQTFRRHYVYGSDRDLAFGKISAARLRLAFYDHPEWAGKGYSWESVRRRLYWLHLDDEKKAKRIAAMTEYNRSYRAENREATNSRAREYRAKNKDVINSSRRVARVQMSQAKALQVKEQAVIYQQLLALAGLAPWQKKK